MAITIPAVCGIFSVCLSLLTPRAYTSVASFTPIAADASANRLSSLAAQFGVNVGAAGRTQQSPDFYAELLKSNWLLGRLVDSTYTTTTPGDSPKSLVELLQIRQSEPAVRRELAMRRLRTHMTVSTGVKTGLVTIEISTQWPTVSFQLASHALALVNQYNTVSRRNISGEERRFTESRMLEARSGLLAAEERLERFLQGNRDYRNSPTLALVAERMQREISMRQQLLTSLAQAFEQAKLEEVRNTPAISIVEQPTVPVIGDSRGTAGRACLAMLFGFLLAALYALARQTWWPVADERGRENSTRAAADELQRSSGQRGDPWGAPVPTEANSPDLNAEHA